MIPCIMRKPPFEVRAGQCGDFRVAVEERMEKQGPGPAERHQRGYVGRRDLVSGTRNIDKLRVDGRRVFGPPELFKNAAKINDGGGPVRRYFESTSVGSNSRFLLALVSQDVAKVGFRLG